MSNIDKQALREAAANAKIAGEAPVMPFDQRITALNDFMKHCTPATVLALLDELEELQSFRTAFTEWLDKTEWVQSDKRFDVIIPWGKHRADVLKLYVEHLESKQEAAEKRIVQLSASHSKLREAMAGIHNTITGGGAYTPMAGILNASKRAYEESAAAAGKGK
jgi:hypothetical protein